MPLSGAVTNRLRRLTGRMGWAHAVAVCPELAVKSMGLIGCVPLTTVRLPCGVVCSEVNTKVSLQGGAMTGMGSDAPHAVCHTLTKTYQFPRVHNNHSYLVFYWASMVQFFKTS